MGFLQIKDPPSLTPPLAGSPGQGAVDRLATFFLSKFQETKKDSELTALQCTTQLKFEATEKVLEEHTMTIAGLRIELQSFWDKAPSFFLHKFSAQLDALGTGRSEKTELALARLEHRVDGENKNLSDQLSDLSIKLAISNAALNATVDSAGKKIAAGNEASAENLRRCESEFRSKMSRLESLLDAIKTGAAIERDKITKTFQEASRRLQSKVDSLELTLMRQSEELTGRREKIDRLEEEVQKLSQLSVGQEEVHSTVVRMLSAQGKELAKSGLQVIRPKTPPRRASHAVQHPVPRVGLSIARAETLSLTAQPPKIASLISSTEPRYKNSSLQPAATNKTLAGRLFNGPATFQYDQQNSDHHVPIHLKRPHSDFQEKDPLGLHQAKKNISEPSPKRQQTGNKKSVKRGAEMYVNESSGFFRQVSVDIKEPRPIQKSSSIQRQASRPEAMKQPLIKSLETQKPNPTTVPLHVTTETQRAPSISRQKLEEKQELPNSLRMTPRLRSSPNQGGPLIEQNYVPLRQYQELLPKKAQYTQRRTRSQIAGPSQGRGDIPTYEKKMDGGSRQQTFPTRREATIAFMLHVRNYARQFSASPPRSERQFIWSFLEGIPDQAWAEFVQRKLLEAYPMSVRPSLTIRAKHSINFDSGLVWGHVLELIRGMQQKAGAAP